MEESSGEIPLLRAKEVHRSSIRSRRSSTSSNSPSRTSPDGSRRWKTASRHRTLSKAPSKASCYTRWSGSHVASPESRAIRSLLEGLLGTVVVHNRLSGEIISFEEEKPLAMMAAYVRLIAVEAQPLTTTLKHLGQFQAVKRLLGCQRRSLRQGTQRRHGCGQVRSTRLCIRCR
ncbi:uncharacterized protein LOC110435146 [Sorghum bicolor]|uniref:uncharacterized protein LOC110435146 n=1 Tax=Sorghum bicolor TaxID=4558 RepID=UPI000B425290|nr:uncharacterized protein LOC110435146 [Sorghum bicolor]|eukprot:XP_021316236.1 uncharacterized protein LOC110435146 [Sorghum bicolor]